MHGTDRTFLLFFNSCFASLARFARARLVSFCSERTYASTSLEGASAMTAPTSLYRLGAEEGPPMTMIRRDLRVIRESPTSNLPLAVYSQAPDDLLPSIPRYQVAWLTRPQCESIRLAKDQLLKGNLNVFITVTMP
jgi:hypothetical protein